MSSEYLSARATREVDAARLAAESVERLEMRLQIRALSRLKSALRAAGQATIPGRLRLRSRLAALPAAPAPMIRVR